MKTMVTIDGTTHEVASLGISGAVAFERHFGIPASVLNPDDPTPNRMEWTAFVIYKSLQKMGVVEKTTSFDDTLEVLDGAKVEQIAEPGDDGYEGDEVPDPTQAPEAPPVS